MNVFIAWITKTICKYYQLYFPTTWKCNALGTHGFVIPPINLGETKTRTDYATEDVGNLQKKCLRNYDFNITNSRCLYFPFNKLLHSL